MPCAKSMGRSREGRQSWSSPAPILQVPGTWCHQGGGWGPSGSVLCRQNPWRMQVFKGRGSPQILCLSEVWAVCLVWGFPLSVSLFLGRRGLKICGLFLKNKLEKHCFSFCFLFSGQKVPRSVLGRQRVNGHPQKAGRGGKAFSSVHGIPLGQSLSGWGPRGLMGLFWGCWQSPDTSQPFSPAPSPGRVWGGLRGCGVLLRAGSQRGAAPGDSGLWCHPLPV